MGPGWSFNGRRETDKLFILLTIDVEKQVLYTSPRFNIMPKGSSPDPASGQSSIPSEIQPYLQTPGIVLPKDKQDATVNTTLTGNSTEQALPKFDGSSASFGTFKPATHSNNAIGRDVIGDLAFLTVIAVFTALVVTS